MIISDCGSKRYFSKKAENIRWNVGGSTSLCRKDENSLEARSDGSKCLSGSGEEREQEST